MLIGRCVVTSTPGLGSIEVDAKQALKRPQQERQVNRMDRPKNIDVAAVGLDILAQSELLMKPGRGHWARPHCTCVAGRHRSAPYCARSSAQIFRETAQL